jgi:hypothetical protein
LTIWLNIFEMSSLFGIWCLVLAPNIYLDSLPFSFISRSSSSSSATSWVLFLAPYLLSDSPLEVTELVYYFAFFVYVMENWGSWLTVVSLFNKDTLDCPAIPIFPFVLTTWLICRILINNHLF